MVTDGTGAHDCSNNSRVSLLFQLHQVLVCLLTLIITLSALLWDEALHAEITRVREKLQEAETSDEKCTKIEKQTRHTPTQSI